MVVDQPYLKQLLQDKAGSKTAIVTFAAKTIPPLRKKNNPYLGRVHKISKVNGIIGIWSYQNSVNRQRDKEGVEDFFVPIERRWGKRIPQSPFVEYQDKLYLEVRVNNSNFAYYLDNQLAPDSDVKLIESFIPEKNESLRQMVDSPIVLRDYEICNITHLQMGGDIFEVV